LVNKKIINSSITTVNYLAVEPVGRREGQADCPDGGTRQHAAADLSEAGKLVEGGEEAVDTESDQGVDAGELVTLAEHRRHLLAPIV